MGGGAFYRAEPLGYGGACSNDGGGLAAAAFPHAGLAKRHAPMLKGRQVTRNQCTPARTTSHQLCFHV
jgi:hypothetical protein